MLAHLNNRVIFSILFLGILAIDIYVKITQDTNAFRYFTKPLVMLSLILFFIKNNSDDNRRHTIYMFSALGCFLIGDLALIHDEIPMLLMSGMVFFTMGKLFYSFRLSHKSELNMPVLIAFLLVVFLYVFFIFNLIYNNLGIYLFPVASYIFISMFLLMTAFLRYKSMDRINYNLLMLGVLLFIASESLMAIKLFYADTYLQDVMIMFLYGMAQFFILLGIIDQKNNKIVSREF